jgi:predicted O-linked N-acetylglucosamine transferase (SPINDLY family)
MNTQLDDLSLMLQRAREFSQSGQLAAAAGACEELLQRFPEEPRALHLRGVIELRGGRHAAAASFISRSLAADPNQTGAYSNLAVALLELRRPAEALASADRALQLQPNDVTTLYNRAYALNWLRRLPEALAGYEAVLRIEPQNLEALTNRGDVLRSLGRLAEAVDSYERALSLQSGFVPALVSRGIALLELGQLQQALASIERAVDLAPDHLPALAAHGRALFTVGRTQEALACFDAALRANPQYHEALLGRGNVLRSLGKPAEALESYDRALQIQPQNLATLRNRGSVLHEQKRLAEAIASYDAALAVHPSDASTLRSRADALRELGHHDEAIAAYERGLEAHPQNADLLFGLANALHLAGRNALAMERFRQVLEIDPLYPYAQGSLLHLQMHCADWSGWAEGVQRVDQALEQGRRVAFPFPLLSFSHSPRQQLRCAQIFAVDNHSARPLPMYRGERYAHDRIRLAYLSADFREHPVAHLAAGLFERHDRSRFHTIALSLLAHPQPSVMRERLRGAFDQFEDVSSYTDRDVAQLLRDLEVDIAVDLTGYTTGARPGILAFRPTPIQVSWLGYPGTLGVDYIDYLIADPIVVPTSDEVHYTERIVRLPHCYLPNDAQSRHAQKPTRAVAGLPETGFVFCAFNNINKINPQMFDIWMRLLQKTPQSVLWLRDVEPPVAARLRSEALARGIPGERLVFAPHTREKEQHLARYALADLFLDTLPYNAHATAVDALYVGVPVLTCTGTTFAGRVATSLLNAVGLPELVTSNLQDYEALALRLASSPAELAALRAKLAEHQSTHPLFDGNSFREHLESAFHSMWERHQKGLLPAEFEVTPAPPDASDRPSFTLAAANPLPELLMAAAPGVSGDPSIGAGSVTEIFEEHFRNLGGCDRYLDSLAFVEPRVKALAAGLRPEQIKTLFGEELTHINYPTFRALCERIAALRSLTIVETGSSAHGTNSSALFARIAAHRGGAFTTIDLNPQVTAQATQIFAALGCSGCCTALCGESIGTLRSLTGRFNVAYLDSYDLTPEEFVASERHGLAELQTLLERDLLDAQEAYVLVDDTPRTIEILATQVDDSYLRSAREHVVRYGRLPGKGALIAEAVRSNPDFEILAWEYQLLLKFSRLSAIGQRG